MGVARLWREAPQVRQLAAGVGVCTLVAVIGPPACTPTAGVPQAAPVASGGSYVPSAASAATNKPAGLTVSDPAAASNPTQGTTPAITVVRSPSAPAPYVTPEIAPNDGLEGVAIRQPAPRRPSEGFATISPRATIADDGAIKPRTFQ